MVIIVLGGPPSSYQQVRTALASKGYELAKDSDWGLVPESPGELFITCEGPDIDDAYAVACGFGFRLRAHWEKSEPTFVPGLTPEQRLARVEHDLAILKAGGVG